MQQKQAGANPHIKKGEFKSQKKNIPEQRQEHQERQTHKEHRRHGTKYKLD